VTSVDRPDNGQDDAPEVVHACPEGTSGVTGCCGRTPFELNRWSRMTTDPASVTCRRSRPAVAEQAAAEARGASRVLAELQGLLVRQPWSLGREYALDALDQVARAPRPADEPCPSTHEVTEDGITAVVHCLADPGHEEHANQGRTW
jgi:hypothetical protein